MEPMTLALGVLWVASIFGGHYVAAAKRRSTMEGIIFGAVFGPLGMLVAACLPDDGLTARERDMLREDAPVLPVSRSVVRRG